MQEARWKRVVLKLSGEAFAGEGGYGIDGHVVQESARDLLHDVGEHREVDLQTAFCDRVPIYAISRSVSAITTLGSASSMPSR